MAGTTEHLTITDVPEGLTVRHHDAVLASSTDALKVTGEREGAVYYFPKSDVYLEHMSVSSDGHLPDGRSATFYTVSASGGGLDKAAWEIVEGSDGRLNGYIGFDSNRVSLVGL